MKILAASDLHGDRKKIEKLADKSKKENVDLVILCGDLTYSEADLTGIIGPFKKANKKVLLIPGNHESVAAVDFLAKQYGPEVYNMHGRAITFYNEIGIFGFGLADVGLFSASEKEMEKCLKKAHEPIKDAKFKILMTHMPPYKTKLDMLWAPVGSKSIRHIIEETQPDICICGHIHETFGMEDKIGKTKIFNVGTEGIVFDIKKKEHLASS